MVILRTCLGGRSSRTSPFLRRSCNFRCRSAIPRRTVALWRSRTVIVNELQYRGQLLLMILDGRTSQRPGAHSSQSFQRIAGIVTVLDPLGLVRHHHIPCFPAHRGLGVAAEIRPQGVVADKGYISLRRPLP